MSNFKKIVAAISAVMIALCLASCGTEESIDLSEYLDISVSGTDGKGVASYSLDKDAFLEDYAGKISMTNEGEGNMLLSSMSALGEAPADILLSCVGGSFDQKTGLSNGDIITFTWEIDMDAEKYFGIRLDTEPVHYTVTGLEPAIETVDPEESEEPRETEPPAAETQNEGTDVQEDKESDVPEDKAMEVPEAETENTETQEVEENSEISETADTAEEPEEIVMLPSEDVIYGIAEQFNLWAGNAYGFEGSLIRINTDLAAELAATTLFSCDQNSLGKDYYDFDTSEQYYLIPADLLQNRMRNLFGSEYQLSDFSNTAPSTSVFTAIEPGYHFFRNCLFITGDGQYRYNFVGTGAFNNTVPYVESIDTCSGDYAVCVDTVRYDLLADDSYSISQDSAGSRVVEFGLNPDPSTDTGWAIATIRIR